MNKRLWLPTSQIRIREFDRMHITDDIMKTFPLYSRIILPKMLVIVIDTVILIAAFLISFTIVPPTWFTSIFNMYFLGYLAVYIIISWFVFNSMSIPKNILRFSNIPNLYKLFTAVLITTVVFAVSIILALLLFKLPAFEPSLLIVNFAISSTALVMLRIAVKGVFTQIQKQPEDYNDVAVIYGADKSSIIMKHAIESSGKFYIAGFLEAAGYKTNKRIEQRRVFNIDTLLRVKDRLKINTLIVTNDNVQDHPKREVIKECIKNSIRVVKLSKSGDLANDSNVEQVKSLNIDDLLQRDPIIMDKITVCKQTEGKRILITGASGSIGSEIVRQVLICKPEIVILCDYAESPLHDLQMELKDNYPETNVKLIIINIQNTARMRKIFEEYQPDIIFHSAAYKHVPLMEHNPSEAVLSNVIGTKNLADLALEYKTEKFIMISTDKAINPTNVMGATKRMAELYLQSLHRKGSKTKFIITRFGNVLGTNGSVMLRFKKQIENGGPVTVTHPDITRYFMTITEAAQLVMEASAIGKGGEILIFDMGEPVKIVDLAKNMISMSGFIPEVDIKITFSGLRPGEKLHEEVIKADEFSVPSHHPKIRISLAENKQHNDIEKYIAELTTMLNGSDLDIVKKIKEAVPEFVSNSSI